MGSHETASFGCLHLTFVAGEQMRVYLERHKSMVDLP